MNIKIQRILITAGGMLIVCILAVNIILTVLPDNTDLNQTQDDSGYMDDVKADYTTWHMVKQCQNMYIDADISGYDTETTVKKLQCTKAAWTEEEEKETLSLIYPYIATNISYSDIQLYMLVDGKALGYTWDRQAVFGLLKDEYEYDDLSIAFSDSNLSIRSEQWSPYETVTYASTATSGYEYAILTFDDLSFSSKEQIINHANEILGLLNISTEAVPFSLLAYSDNIYSNTLSYRSFYSKNDDTDKMAPYKEKVYEYGSECYELNYSVLYNDIPTSRYEMYFTMEDTYNTAPSVTIRFNKNGILNLRARNIFTVTGESEPAKLVSLDTAVDTVDSYLGNLILSEDMVCRKVRLEYYALYLKGGISERDYELVPMWTFYFDNGGSPVIVDAITGELVW